MAFHVCHGAPLKCSFGMAPSSLVVLPDKMTMTSNAPAANIQDHVPMKNIMPFGMCQSLANPQVASATAAAQGALTPMPCSPVTPAPWAPGAQKVMLANMPVLDDTSTLNCSWGGVITVTMAGQTTEMVP